MDKEQFFLGQGWAFPPEFYDAITPTRTVSEEEEIRQSLNIIFSTRVGERVMNPLFGSTIHNLIHYNMDLTARTQLIAAIEKTVLYFEPRIILNTVNIDVSEERKGILKIILEYTIRLTNTRSNMVYPYYYEEYL